MCVCECVCARPPFESNKNTLTGKSFVSLFLIFDFFALDASRFSFDDKEFTLSFLNLSIHFLFFAHSIHFGLYFLCSFASSFDVLFCIFGFSISRCDEKIRDVPFSIWQWGFEFPSLRYFTMWNNARKWRRKSVSIIFQFDSINIQFTLCWVKAILLETSLSRRRPLFTWKHRKLFSIWFFHVELNILKKIEQNKRLLFES